MAAPKFASLHPGLLARKGEARPASTQDFVKTQFTDDPIALTPSGGTPHWPPPSDGRRRSLTPVPQNALDKSRTRTHPQSHSETPAQPRAPISRVAPSAGSAEGTRKSAVRITDRHKRLLLLLKVVKNRPHTEVTEKALEAYLRVLAQDEMKHCACFRKALMRNETVENSMSNDGKPNGTMPRGAVPDEVMPD